MKMKSPHLSCLCGLGQVLISALSVQDHRRSATQRSEDSLEESLPPDKPAPDASGWDSV